MITADTFRLDGRLALVTGSSSGIGLAIARGLGQAGASVVLNGRDLAKLTAVADTLLAEGLSVHLAAFDVTDGAAVDVAVASIEAQRGPIEILVNNAGLQRRGVFHEFKRADWDAVMRTNIDSVFLVGQAVASAWCCASAAASSISARCKVNWVGPAWRPTPPARAR